MTNDQAMAELGYTVNGAGYYRVAMPTVGAAMIQYSVVFDKGAWWAVRRIGGQRDWRAPTGLPTPMAAVALAELREWGKS